MKCKYGSLSLFLVLLFSPDVTDLPKQEERFAVCCIRKRVGSTTIVYYFLNKISEIERTFCGRPNHF